MVPDTKQRPAWCSQACRRVALASISSFAPPGESLLATWLRRFWRSLPVAEMEGSSRPPTIQQAGTKSSRKMRQKLLTDDPDGRAGKKPRNPANRAVVDTYAAIRARTPQRVPQAVASAAVNRNASGAAVKSPQYFRVRSQVDRPGSEKAIRIGLPNPLQDGKQPNRCRRAPMTDDRPKCGGPSTVLEDDEAATRKGELEEMWAVGQHHAVAENPAPSVVGAIGQPQEEPLTALMKRRTQHHQVLGRTAPRRRGAQYTRDLAPSRPPICA